MIQLGYIAALLAMTWIASAADSYPTFPPLPNEEATRRSSQVFGTWSRSPVLGDDHAFDKLAASLETRIVRREVLLFDDLGLLGTNALVSLEREILHLGKEEEDVEVPDPTTVKPNFMATHLIMGNQPYCAKAAGLADDDDPLVRQLAHGLVDAGEAGLDVNIAGALATALATTADGGMTIIESELRQRSAQLRQALAGGYRNAGLPIVQTPFDHNLATWCLWPRPVGEEDLFTRANAAFTRHRNDQSAAIAVEQAWQQVVSTYQTIHGTRGASVLGWKQAIAGVVLPVLLEEMVSGLAEFEAPEVTTSAGIPLPGSEAGSKFASQYSAWMRTGGAYLHTPAEMAESAGGATLPRMRLIGAVWLFDRLLEDLTQGTVGLAASMPFDLEAFSVQLEPLRNLSSAVIGQGPSDEQLSGLRSALAGALKGAQVYQAAMMQQLAAWHPKLDAIPSLDGWNLTARRTVLYCHAIGVLGKALADEAKNAATRDFLRLQRDVAAMLVLYDQQYANYGPPMLYSHVRAIRLGVAALAARTSIGSTYTYGPIPSAGSRVLRLPERIPFETDVDYWKRACIDVIFPSFMRNQIERGVREVALVWIRSRAGSTRMASVALDRLMVGAWSVRSLIKEGKSKR